MVSNFCERGYIPGYAGYVPKWKYQYGKTFGSYAKSSNQGPPPPLHYQTPLCKDASQLTGTTQHSLEFTSGYTGFIPQHRFTHGDSFKVESRECMINFRMEQQKQNQRQTELHNYTKLPSMVPTVSKDVLLQSLRNFNMESSDRHFKENLQRSFTNPRMSGYAGFIPHIKLREVGLGTSYVPASSTAFKQLWNNRQPTDQNREVYQ